MLGTTISLLASAIFTNFDLLTYFFHRASLLRIPRWRRQTIMRIILIFLQSLQLLHIVAMPRQLSGILVHLFQSRYCRIIDGCVRSTYCYQFYLVLLYLLAESSQLREYINFKHISIASKKLDFFPPLLQDYSFFAFSLQHSNFWRFSTNNLKTGV